MRARKARVRYLIAANKTVSDPEQPSTDAPLASQRAELLGQLVAAQFALEHVAADLARSGSSSALTQNQLSAIANLQRQVGQASPADLAGMTSAVAAIVADARMTGEQARTQANAAQTADAVDITTLATAARAQASSFMRDLRQYDDLLQFGSDAERDAYRQREQERQRRYETGMADGTPEGALGASGAALGQAVDLAAHGGSADPALMRRIDELAASTSALRDKIIRDGGDVAKFDAAMRDDLRAIMRSKGISDAEIDALLAAHKDNPIEAMKAYIGESDIARLNQSAINASSATADTSIVKAEAPETAPGLETIMADLQGSGITVSEVASGEEPNHGVNAAVPKQEALVRLS